ncbi:MAG: DSD1 family PLP-dependent enzyme [Planctomycetota bacterium]|nr:DSD1 family PLP-dependent enzyme [Planctomycetota bacterium]
MRYKDIDTPALLVDLDILEKNLDVMAGFFADKPVDLRPHVKTHKTPAIAQMQIDRGAIGVTCAKLGEAEVMAAAGIPGLLIANQIVGAPKVKRLAELARKSNVIVTVDNASNVREIANAARKAKCTVRMVIEIEIGMKRCGVSSKDAVELAKVIRRTKGVEFKGILGYEGHCISNQDDDFRTTECHLANERTTRAMRTIERAGIPVEIVTGGGTGTYDITGIHDGFTEVEAGSYVFMDHVYTKIRPDFGIALSLLCTVVSRPASNRGVLDGGLKTFGQGFELPKQKNCPGLKLRGLSEEHGPALLSGKARDLKVGDRVEVYSGHCCETVNLHERIYGVRKGKVEVEWPIEARGKLA